MKNELYHIYTGSKGVSTDTRSDLKGKVFFCLKGPNFDANTFALDALAKGAIHVVSDNEGYAGHEGITVVPDALASLQELARTHRAHFGFPVIGLTGSNGKTTNKELIAAVLSRKYRTHSTKGNLNNHIGVPLTLLEIPMDAEMAVIEMGANHQGEIRLLSSICDPDCGMITNIGKAHLEGFGGIEGVRKGKGELFDHLRKKKNCLVFINGDDPVLMEMSEGMNRVQFGSGPMAKIRGRLHQNSASDTLVFSYEDDGFQSEVIHTQLAGHYNFSNFLAAVCIGRHFNVSHSDIKLALETYAPKLNRSQLHQTSHNKLIMDAYNANPSSMQLAVEHFASLKAERKVAILGHMLELGDTATKEHQDLIDLLVKSKIEAILVGKHYEGCDRKGFAWFADTDTLSKHLKGTPIKNATILLKGSRLVALEKLVPYL